MRRVFLTLVLAGAASAQNPLSLRDAVSEALTRHPRLSAGAERVAASEGLLVQAGIRPNPRVYFQAENLRAHGTPGFRFGQDADTFAYLSQVLETGGKRQRRASLASAAVRRAQFDGELLRRQIATGVKLAYWNAVSAEKQHDLLRENMRTFGQIVEYHEVRVKEGAMAEADLLRVRLEGERLAIAANAAALEAERARIALFREMGRTSFEPVRFAEPLEPDRTIVDVDASRAADERVEVKLARQIVDEAQANASLQRALGKPDVEFTAGLKHTLGFSTALGGIQVNLPVSDRNQGNVAAADREIRAAEAELAAEQALVRAEIEAARREYEMRRRQVTEILPPMLDHAAESARIALAAYREGGADLLRLLDAERTRIEIESVYFRTLGEYRQSRVALETALGMEP